MSKASAVRWFQCLLVLGALGLTLGGCKKSKPAPNAAPVISRLAAAPSVVAPGGQLEAVVVASDPQGDSLAYAWTIPDGWTAVGPADAARVVLRAPAVAGTGGILQVEVTDGRGGSATDLLEIGTAEAAGAVALSIDSIEVGPAGVAPGGQVAVVAAVTNPTGRALTYRWAVDDDRWTMSTDGARARLVAPLIYGAVATISLTVEDGIERTASSAALVTTSLPQSPEVSAILVTPPAILPAGAATLRIAAASGVGLPLAYAWTACDGWSLTGEGPQVTIQAPASASGACPVSVTVTDAAGGLSRAVGSVELLAAGPVIRYLAATPQAPLPGERVELRVVAESPVGQALRLEWESDAGWPLTPATTGALLSTPLEWSASSLVTVRATDEQGRAAEASIMIANVPVAAPLISSLAAWPPVLAPGGAGRISALATTPLGAPLTWLWSVEGTGWSITPGSGEAIISAPLEANATATVTVTVIDAAGGAAAASLVVGTGDATPVIRSLSLPQPVMAPGGRASVSVIADSLLGLPLSYEWTTTEPGWTVTGSGPAATVEAPMAYGRAAQVRVVVRSLGATKDAQVAVETRAETPPTVESLVAIPSVIAPGGTLNARIDAWSRDGLPLTAEWQVAGAGWTVLPSGMSAAVTAPAGAASSAIVTVTVTDAAGARTSRSMAVASEATSADPGGGGSGSARVATALQLLDGDLQQGAAGSVLAVPLRVRAVDAAGQPVAGAPVSWTVAAGAFEGSPGVLTDANGLAHAVVRLDRQAGRGQAVARLPSTDARIAFVFQGTPGPAVALALEADLGDTDHGALIRIYPADAFGNEVLDDGLAQGADVRISISSTSGSATINAAPLAGTIISGGGTATVDARLDGGRLELRIDDPTSELVYVSAASTLAGYLPYPLVSWQLASVEDASAGLGAWHAEGTVGALRLQAGIAASGSRALELALDGASATSTGALRLVPPWGGSEGRLVRLDMSYRLDVTPGADPSGCTAQPGFRLVGGSASGEIALQPDDGYEILDRCDGATSLGSTGGAFTRRRFILDPAVQPADIRAEVTGSPRSSTPNSPAAWYLDDLLVTLRTAPSFAAVTTTAVIRPGAPAALRLGPPADAPVALIGTCTSGPAAADLTATVVDAHGNQTDESALPIDVRWTGAAEFKSVQVGSLLGHTGSQATVLPFAGKAVVRLLDPVSELVSLSLGDAAGTGLQAPVPASWRNVSYVCHDNGFGGFWSDGVARDTYDATQAMRACESYYGLGQCSMGASWAERLASQRNCAISQVWHYAPRSAGFCTTPAVTGLAETGQYKFWQGSCTCDYFNVGVYLSGLGGAARWH